VITWDVDTSQFDQMIAELSAVCQQPPDEVLREEVGKVLTQAVKNTKAADEADIKRHQATKTHSLQPATLYAAKRPGRRKLRGGKVLYNLSFHYPDRLWASIARARMADLKKRIRARGLAKQSFYKLGLLLGLPVEAPDYVRKAVPRSGKTYSDERASAVKGSGSNIITIETNQPTLVAIHGERALQQAIDGRSQFFYTNVARNVFDSMWSAAKKYPGLYSTP
jgi:hypothetical protein